MGFTMRTYNCAGVFMERHMPEAATHDEAEAELRNIGLSINRVPGQKTWRSDLLRDGQRIATCRGGKWTALKP